MGGGGLSERSGSWVAGVMGAGAWFYLYYLLVCKYLMILYQHWFTDFFHNDFFSRVEI